MNDLANHNSSFSRVLPGMQIAIDSTSLGEFKSCPRKYFYSIVMGWEPKEPSADLAWGLLYHQGCEIFDQLRAKGLSFADAVDEALRQMLLLTWDRKMNRPMSWGHPQKTRPSLIRALIWYWDQYGENDPIEPVILANGKAAVELSFSFDSGIATRSTGERILLCGHLDKIGKLNGGKWIVDRKSTKGELGPRFFNSFSPNNQMSLYSFAGKVAFGEATAGLIIDGVQIGATFARFQRHVINRDQSQLEEWYADTALYFVQMEVAARTAQALPPEDVAQAWPMNDKSCDQYGGCKFREVCSRPKKARGAWLQAAYQKRVWDPLRARGDI